MEVGSLTDEAAMPVGVSRRTMVAAAAWAVPAISVATAVPAWASSTSNSRVALAVPDNQLPASGSKPIVATVTDRQGTPQAGQPVSLTGPTGSVIAAPNGVTDGAGQYATTIDLSDPWEAPGSTVTLTALSGDGSATLPVTVLGSNLITSGSGGLAQTPLLFPSPVVSYSQMWGLAVLADGSVWKNSGKWAVMPEITDAAQVSTSSSGSDSAYVLKKDGTIVGWGVNNRGQLGDGTTVDRSSPVAFQGLSDVIQIQAGQYGLHALKRDGTVWYQGSNTGGRAGVGSTANPVPLSQVPLPARAIQVVNWAGLSGGVVLKDGTVWTWGLNDQGQLGDGTTTQQSSPVKVLGLSGVTALAGAPEYALYAGTTWIALRNDGSVWTWGRNGWGQLGYGGTNPSTTPTQVPGVSDIVQVAMLPGAAYALKSDGTLLAWGRMPGGVARATPAPFTVPASPPIRSLIDTRGHVYSEWIALITAT